MARGDIRVVELPAPSGSAGHEQIGHRPAIVVQTDTTDRSLPTTMVVPLTSNLKALRYPYTSRVDPTPQNGLTTPSVLLAFQLRAIDRRRLGRKIGQLDEDHMEQLEAAMRLLLGL